MRYFLSVILVLLLVGWAQGATYYVAPDGDDMMAGTSAETAWETIDRLNAQTLVAGDTVTLGGTAKNPLRGSLILDHAGADGTPITVAGGYIAASLNLADGYYVHSSIMDTSTDYWFQRWASDTDLAKWTETIAGGSTVNKETVGCLTNSVCLRMDVDVSDSTVMILESTAFQVGGEGYIEIIYKTTAGGYIKYDWREPTSQYFMGADGSFTSTSLYQHILPSSETWTKYTSPTYNISYNGTPRLRIYGEGAEESIYIQSVKVHVAPAWDLYSNDIYRVNFCSGQTTGQSVILKSTTWDVDGLDGLEFAHSSESLETIEAGEFWEDTTNKFLYYRLLPGESIETIHVEATFFDEGIYITEDYNNLSGVHQYGAKDIGIKTEGAIANFEDIYISRSALYGAIDQDGSTTVWTDSKFYKMNDMQAENGANGCGTNASDSTYIRCESSYNGDDGFQVNGGGTINMYNCISHHNGSQQLTVTDGGGNFYNNIFYDATTDISDNNYSVSDKEESGQARVYYNNFIYADRDDVPRAFGVVNATGITESNNGWYGGANAPHAPYGETNGLNVDPGFDNDFNTTAWELLEGGLFIAGFHDTYEEDFDGTYIPPYRVPIGAQGFAPTSNLRWGKIYGRH